MGFEYLLCRCLRIFRIKAHEENAQCKKAAYQKMVCGNNMSSEVCFRWYNLIFINIFLAVKLWTLIP